MITVKGFHYFWMLALVVLGQVEAQKPSNLQPHGARSLDNVLRVTKVQQRTKTADFDLEVQRLSEKAITAYGLDLSMRYADGSQRKTGVGYDLIETLVPEVPGFPLGYSGLTQYGQYHKTTVNVPSDDAGAPPVAVSATVSWVMFDDKTVSGSGAFQVITQGRKEESRYLSDLVTELRDAKAHAEILAKNVSAIPGQPVFQDQPVLQKAIMGLELEAQKSPQTGIRGRRNGDLGLFATAAFVSTAKFDALLDRYADLQVLLAEHCDLKESK